MLYTVSQSYNNYGYYPPYVSNVACPHVNVSLPIAYEQDRFYGSEYMQKKKKSENQKFGIIASSCFCVSSLLLTIMAVFINR